MRIPDFLAKNDTIGFAAPSFGCNIEPYKSAFDHACQKIADRGYALEIGPNCYEGAGVGISNTPEKCGQEIMDFFSRDTLGAVFSCGGGELMCEILDFIDFNQLKKEKPKWYVGYSDNTNLVFLLATICDTASVYGPCAPAFGMEPWHQSLEDTFGLLTGELTEVSGYPLWEKESLKDEEHPLAPYHVTEKRVMKCFPKEDARIEGRLIGGCLDCLGRLAGTKYDAVEDFVKKYKEDGIIWYMEACELNVMDIRRVLWQLEHAGWFKHVKGFLIGRPLCHGQEMFGLSQYTAVTGILGRYNVPILMDLDIGHFAPMMPIINGAYAEVSAEGNDITIRYRL